MRTTNPLTRNVCSVFFYPPRIGFAHLTEWRIINVFKAQNHSHLLSPTSTMCSCLKSKDWKMCHLRSNFEMGLKGALWMGGRGVVVFIE